MIKYTLDDEILTMESFKPREVFLLGKIAGNFELSNLCRFHKSSVKSWVSICNGGTAHLQIPTEALTDFLLSRLT